MHIRATEKPKAGMLTAEQKTVVNYFQEVALGFEYGNVSPVTRKWKTDMRIYVGGSPDAAVRQELESIVEELNSYFKDGFQMQLVDQKDRSNMFIYFGDQSTYSTLYPRQSALLKGASGLCTVAWNGRNEITRGHIFIRTEKNSIEEQRHVIREELTQALGFGKDSPRFMDSIFQSSFTTPTQYSEVDKELIRLLYHPRMAAGLDATEVEALVTKIILDGAGA